MVQCERMTCIYYHSSTILNDFRGDWGLRAISGYFWGVDFKTVVRFFLCGQVFRLFDIFWFMQYSFLSLLLDKRVTHFVICETC